MTLIHSLIIIHLSSLDKVYLNYFINKLNKYSIYRKPKYILLFDYIYSPVCEDKNSFIIFQYYQKNNNNEAYYVLNEKTELYKLLLKQNKTNNIIPYKNVNHNEHLFHYILNSKIIIQSYALFWFQIIVSYVDYLKFLYICHAVNYFKISIIQEQLSKLTKSKQNIIVASPYEFYLYKKLNLYEEKSMTIGGLARYDRFQYNKKNLSEKCCILISFTYRSFKNSFFRKSLLIFIQHHNDVKRKRNINIPSYVKYISQKYLAYYIKKCSLLITDFSSISFDFMFQNKPVLFYHLDKYDKLDFKEKEYMKIDYNNSIYYNNIYSDHHSLVNKIKYYVKKNFVLENGLAKKYKTLFYLKSNITQKIVEKINNIIKKD